MRDVIRFFLDPWIVVGAVGFGAALLIATLLLLWLTRPPQSAGGTDRGDNCDPIANCHANLAHYNASNCGDSRCDY